ncbi:MAG: S-layer homology domain-containing protein, partial [Oscillospiraceae bacterium]
ASAASGYGASMQKLVDWGIMRGDQQGNLNPNRAITRAEFATMINRAYGYEQVVPIEFTDVKPGAWYAEDIAIGYGAGYFKGATKTKADPLGTLTREQATVILGRNLMYQEGTGEVLGFSDSRELGNWSRGLIQTAVEQEIIHGYPDGSFRPKRNVSRGEVASILANAIGTPVNKAGNYTLGGAYGNVTISAAGTTLRNTTIAGDLYITGGLGKGAITLENVTVLGKIVVSGAGESEKGDSSVILRNVTAKEMLLDSPASQFITLRAEGDTAIDTVNVRTHAYLEDRTPSGLGLKKIILDGEEKTNLELAGNIEEVINKTPKSLLKMAKGQALSLTMDELAVDGTLTIENGASIKTLNLDLATKVTGKGDVETLHVNAPGCKVELLPDKITIRPGLTADVGGEKMDTITAQESSEDPRLLTGYPWARNIAPTGASGTYSTNKKGVVYWGVSAITDGSVGEADLIKPPTYGSTLLKSGHVKLEKSNTELQAPITGLTSGGSYYLSAVLVDSRDRRSPVKVTAFSTPDDSVPDFAAGYPVFSKLTNNSAQVTVMPTKSCQLYYALLPKGAVAPTPKDFKANSIPGNLGFGTREVTKNVSAIFTVNDKPLEEVKSYDLYLWLTDIDGAKSSAVKKMDFTTLDRTAPLFNPPPMVTDSKATSIGMTCMLNEAGDIYWTAVKTGTDYPKPMPGQSGPVDLKSEAAKLQIVSGMGALKSGKAAATANKSTALNIAGLTVQTAYDVYYVARDKAG